KILPGHARHGQRGIPERGLRQTHREFGLLSGHHRRPGCGEADRPRHAAAVARTGHGPEPGRWRVQQRLRVRLSELSLLVFTDDTKLLFDLQVLAFQADITRIVTFQLTRELNNRTYPEIGVPDPHHPTSHHGNDPQKLLKISKINTFHVSLFAYFLEKLKSTPDGDGSLLDNTVYLYGSGLGNSSIHDHENLPILVAGGAASGMRGGRHIRYKNGTPLANLHLTLL